MPGNKQWTAEQLEYLEKHYHLNDMPAMIKFLGKSKYAIQWKASQLGILQRDGKQKKASYKKIINLTKEHHDFLKKSRNNSKIVRLALDMYIKSLKKKG